MELSKIIFSFLLLFFGYFFNKHFLLILKKSNFSLLIDNQFKKPQAFHDQSTLRVGGITIFVLLIITFLYLFIFENIILIEHLSFTLLFFFLGLMDDIKVKMTQTLRLILMVVFLFLLVTLNELYIKNTGLSFLNDFLESSKIFSIIFICLCFLFIINGANLVDGFNGLLGIHSLIIFSVLFVINLLNGNNELSYILFFACLVIIIFLKFNFPKAEMFLGDSGSYLLGAFIAVSIINTSISDQAISPFFFCILLVYLFFEAFFTFPRKYFVEKKHPLHPDGKHLHMLIYKFLLKNKKTKFESNYKVSLYINSVYLLMIAPSFFFMNNNLFCKFYFLLLILFYFYFYMIFTKKIK